MGAADPGDQVQPEPSLGRVSADRRGTNRIQHMVIDHGLAEQVVDRPPRQVTGTADRRGADRGCAHDGVRDRRRSGDTGDGGPRVDRSAWTISIYGTISVAVVVAEYASSSPGRLALLVLGYGFSLWLAHGYAGVVSAAFATWPSSRRHAWPVAESTLPALAVLGPATLLGWPTHIAVPLALVACLANLVAVQIAVLRRGGPRSAGRIAATIALDVVAGAVVLAVLTLLR